MIGPAQLIARSLVVGAYPDDEIRNALLDRFPEHDPDELIADARDWFDGLDEELAAAEIDELRRAVAAEHDTTQTMHEED